MTDDATALLIKRMLSQTQQPVTQNISAVSDSLSDFATLVGTAANFAQVLSTAEGPTATAAALAYLKQLYSTDAATLEASTAGQAAIMTAGAWAAGIGAAVVLVFSFVLAAIVGSTGPGSVETQLLEQLGEALGNLQQDFNNVDLANYWQGKLDALQSAWNSGQGGLGDDLDNLAEEGIGPNATYVHQYVGNFHDDAMGFVNTFIPAKSLGVNTFWERPVLVNQGFATKPVPYPVAPGWPTDAAAGGTIFMGWYGSLPEPKPAPSFQGAQMVSDPRTMLPFLALGLNGYLTLQMMVNLIDPSQLTFDQFLDQYSGNYTASGDENDFPVYATFIYSNYKMAVNGIVKTDLPGTQDLVGYLLYSTGDTLLLDPSIWSGSSQPQQGASIFPPQPGSVPPSTGYVWNGTYGAADTYPQYGSYQPEPPFPVPSAAPAYVIDTLYQEATNTLQGQWPSWQGNDYLFRATIIDWVLPWLKNRLILGRMARWKAIYLLNGYDRIWSILQKLEIVSRPSAPIVPTTLRLDQDGMIADGNWSTRELFAVLDFDGNISDGIQTTDLPPYIYSLSALIHVLDNIANGNWTGPPPYSSNGPGAPRPLSFRGRLAAAAV